ncbi:TraB/GumN family protein [Parasphingorhabdus sp.]|uniref:TraB/GumN family protein n=1 Tax=Parasphingorhabdus sp. TaxID=2709688 RepID=UPI003BAF90A6
MIKPTFLSPRLISLLALGAVTPFASPVSAQKTAVEEAVEAVSDAADAATATSAVVESARDAPSRSSSGAIKQVEMSREEREAAYKAVFDFTPSPALWRMADADSTIYIFAGIEGFSNPIKWKSQAITTALESADKVYLETVYYDKRDRETRWQNEREAFRKLIRHDRDRVEDRFDPGLFERIKGDLKSNFFVIGDFMPTWLLITLISDTDRMFQPGRNNQYLDYKITNAVKDRDLKIDGLEEPSHLIDLLNDIDEKKQRKWLNAFTRAELTVEKSQRYRNRKRGPYGRVGPLTAQEHQGITWAKGEPPEAPPVKTEGLRDLYEHIRQDRMKNWSAKIGAMLDDEGTSLIIVSQEYLYGENNLRTALEKKGYKLERMP